MRVGESVADRGIDGDGPYRAARDLLLRRPPRLEPPAQGPLVTPAKTPTEPPSAWSAPSPPASSPSTPPGSGKTYGGAEMALALIAAGRRVGVTANSHKVICNLVARLCKLAEAAGRRLDVVQSGDEDQVLAHHWVRRMKSADIPAVLHDPQVHVVA